MFWFLIAAAVVVAVLVINLLHRFASDGLQVFTDRRRAQSRLVSNGEFVDGNRHVPVALALTDSSFYYENPDVEASIDLQTIHEVEYASELTTGAAIASGKVLRIRCYSQTFEFVLPPDDVARWKTVLPARTANVIASPILAGAAPTLA
jgi:hypothetical protein